MGVRKHTPPIGTDFQGNNRKLDVKKIPVTHGSSFFFSKIAIYTMANISAFFPAVNLRVCVSSEGLPEPRNTIPKVDEGKKSEI